MGVESPNLYQAMRDYVQAAMRLLAEACPEGPPLVLRGVDEWKRDHDNLFRLRDREEPYWMQCILDHQDRLHTVDEYSRLVTALRSIPDIAAQLETVVGTALGSQRVEIAHVTDRLVWRLATSTHGLRFEEGIFRELFHDFESALQRTSFSFICLAPLLGLRIESAPIPLTPNIEIDRMTDDEIAHCLTFNLLPEPFGWRRMAQIRSDAALRVRFQLQKHAGATEAPLAQALKIVGASIERAMAALHALRVFKDGRVSIPGFLQFSSDWPIEGFTHFQYSNPGPMPWSNNYDLSGNQTGQFVAFWTRFENATAKGALANAVRRFSYASDRDRDDDRLVDLMIAAESLFLADAGTPQERGELRYRLAMRAAYFIDSAEHSRRQIFKHMRRAYDARSAIVHGGGEPDRDLLRSPTDASVSLQDFTKVTEHLLRLALKKRIDMVEGAGSPPIDWEALIIPP